MIVTRAEVQNLIITNIMMPNMGSFQFVMALRDAPAATQSKVVSRLPLYASGSATRCYRKRHAWLLCRVDSAWPGSVLLHGYVKRTGRRHQLGELAADPLFGLEYIDKGERLHFHERLALLVDVREAGSLLCVTVIDLDRFSQLNDAHGRQLGDAVLCMVISQDRPFFVSNLGSNPGDAAIVNAVIAVAHRLQRNLVAKVDPSVKTVFASI